MYMMKQGIGCWNVRSLVALFCLLVLTLARGDQAIGQEVFEAGQNVAPVFEGWEGNPDGSFNMVFGYMNRNYVENVTVPIGANNSIEPGGLDQGQPTYFLTRRRRFVFRVKVPADFGKQELVWTVTAHGKTERAYATLRSEFALSNTEIMMNWGAVGVTPRGEDAKNQPPVITLEGGRQRTVKVGESLTLTALVRDDGILRGKTPVAGIVPRAAPRYLRAGWFIYRGSDGVTFDPVQHNPEFGRIGPATTPPRPLPPRMNPAGEKLAVKATFTELGTVMLRLMAHDGGLATTEDVTVTVVSRQFASKAIPIGDPISPSSLSRDVRQGRPHLRVAASQNRRLSRPYG